MHMSDALVSPVVGGALWLTMAVLVRHAARANEHQPDSRRVPLMGVLGAFVFAAQMINFSIPGTGSSGHLAGALMLSVLLGPHAAFLVMASVVTVQALFFADGGLFALGANIINLGFFTCYVAYPWLYRPLVGPNPSARRLLWSSVLTSVVGLELGALAVVVETLLSGLSALPFGTFTLFMLPVHAAIGVVEGLVTAAVLLLIRRARPELLTTAAAPFSRPARSLGPVLVALAVSALLIGGGLSWFASARPDGLEWSLERSSPAQLEPQPRTDALHLLLARVQHATSWLPDYSLKRTEPDATMQVNRAQPGWPAVDAGTSLSGIVGAVMTLLMALGLGLALKAWRARSAVDKPEAGTS